MNKREKFTAIILIIVFLALASTLSLIDHPSITGMAVNTIAVAVDPISNLTSEPLFQPEIEESTNSEPVNSPLLNTQGSASPDLTIQANCIAWPCDCGDTITASVTMTSDLSSCATDPALSIGANFITIDCAGHSLSNQSAGSTGFLISSGNNITVKNCALSNFSIGFNVSGSNLSLSNNTISNSSINGIIANHSQQVTISNNTISSDLSAQITTSAGIYLNDVNDSLVTNNNISHLHYTGIYLAIAKSVTLSYNQILSLNTPGHSVVGISIDSGSINSRIINNTLLQDSSSVFGLSSVANESYIVNNSFYGSVDIGVPPDILGIEGNIATINQTFTGNYLNGSSNSFAGNFTVYDNNFNNSYVYVAAYAPDSGNFSNNILIDGHTVGGTTSIIDFYYNGTINNNIFNLVNYDGITVRSDNLVLQNNTFTNGTAKKGIILISSIKNTSIIDNTFSHLNYSVYASGAVNTSLLNNNFTNISTSAIYLTDSDGYSNVMEKNYFQDNIGYDISLNTANDTIFNNTFIGNNGTSINISGTNTNITNNTFYNQWGLYSNDLNWSRGIRLENTGADVFNNSLDGASITVSTTYAKIRSNHISNSSHGILILDGPNTYLENNQLINNTYNVHLAGNAGNLTFNKTLIINGTYGIYAGESSTVSNTSGNISFFNANLTGSFENNTIYFDSSNSIYLFMFNSTFNQSNVTVANNARLENKYYVDVTIQNYLGTNILGATIYAYNKTEDLEFTGAADNNGFLRLNLTEYYQLSSGIHYNTNHSINATAAGAANGTNINLTETNSTALTLLLNVAPVTCGVINNDTSLISNLNSNGTCFWINASNVTINGYGATITGNLSGYGINSSNFTNITIQNIIITNFSSGIYFNSSDSNNVTETTLVNNTQGMLLINSNNSIIYTNTFHDNSENGTALQNSYNNTFYNNEFISNAVNAWDNGTNNWNTSYDCSSGSNILGYSCLGGNSWDDYGGNDTNYDGIGDQSIPYNSSNNITLGGDYLPLATPTTPISDCQVINITTKVTAGSVITTSSARCFTINGSNLVFDGQGATISLGSSANYVFFYSGDGSNPDIANVTIENFIIKNPYDFTIRFYCETQCNNITFSNISLINSSYGFSLTKFGSGSIVNSTINFSSLGIYLDQANNFDLKDNVYNINSTYSEAINVVNSENVTLINQIFNKYSGTSSNLINTGSKVYTINSTVEDDFSSSSEGYTYFQKYLDINITDSSGNAVPSSTITTYWADDTLETTATTDLTGFSQLPMTYYYYLGDTKFITTPHTVTATKSNYFSNSSSINITNINSFNLTIDPFSCGDNIQSDITLSGSFSSSADCFNISADNVTIDGAGQNLTGDGSGSAININNHSNVIIKNLIISNYSNGINLSFSNSTNLTNVTIHNNTYGLVINTSYDTRCINCNVYNNTLAAAFISNDGGTNTYFINSTINITNVSVSGTASVYVQWYVDVNATFFNATLPLPGANVSGLFNSSQEVDTTTQTLSDGFGRLTLSEVKKNITDTYYLTPHNITAYYNSSSGTSLNSTGINLSTTHSTSVNLNLELSCVVPVDGLNLITNTTLCPGTYSVADDGNDGVVQIGADNLAVTCDNTVITGNNGGKGFFSENRVRTNISSCTANDYDYGFYLKNSDNFSLSDITTADSANYGVYLLSSDRGILRSFDGDNVYNNGNNNFIHDGVLTASVGTVGLTGSGSNNIIQNVSFSGFVQGISVPVVTNYTLRNNTFSSTTVSIIVSGSENNIYYNNFSAASSLSAGSGTQFNTTTADGKIQGNTWLEWCDRGTDLDDDGYADNSTSSTSIDWPYNQTISATINGGTTHFTSSTGQDYGPKIVSCPPTVVQLGSGGSSSSAATTTTESSAAETPASSSSSSTLNEYIPADEVVQKLVPIITSSKDGDNTKIHFSLENTADKPMLLFAALNVSYEDANFILTSKTLAYDGSFWSKLMGLAYSKEPVAGRLLKATIKEETPGEFEQPIRLEPGEKLERTIEVDEGFSVPRQIQFEISAFGEAGDKQKVLAQDIAVDYSSKVSALGVDLDTANHLIDIYTLIVPQLAGTESKNYFLELTFNKQDDGTVFGDLYGPYFVDQSTPLVFAQQFKYNPLVYHGNYTINAKILEGGKVVVDKEFEEMLQ